jgi:two-component system CheB/CheR fusion protein
VRVCDFGEPVQREVRDRAGVSYLLRIVPYRKATGQTDGVVVSLVDVSLVRATEAELRRMSRVFQDGADPIIIEDLNGIIVDLNDEASRAYGYDRSELIGKPATTLLPPELADDGTRLRERCLQREHIRNVETARMTRDGRRVPVLLTLSLITNETREPSGIATIAKDVSKLKWAEEAAHDAVRRRDEFLALLSHELRNPLSAVLNASRVVTRSLDDPEKLHAAAESIDRQAWHMARLLDDLLDVSRVTSGKIHLRKEPLDWREVIGDTAESMSDVFETQEQSFHLAMPDEPVYVDGDRARLYQVAENLLSNASKYTPRGGRIDVSLIVERATASNGDDHDGAALHDGERFGAHLRGGRDYESCAVLRVRDNGSGIESALLPHIFDMFTQSERTLARSDGGMGVGLTLVRNLVALHGGEIAAESDGPHRGSVFTVRLPLTTRRPASAAPAPSASCEPCRVLIVEDNADARRTLALLLKMEGHEVAQADDGEAGLAALVEAPPDVALVDIGLPRIDGLEVARRARANPNLAEVVLVAVTGYGQDSDYKAIIEAGFDEHLVKPIRSEQLAEVLSRNAKPR